MLKDFAIWGEKYVSVDHKIQFRDMSEIMVLKRSHGHLQRMRQILPTEKQNMPFHALKHDSFPDAVRLGLES